MSANGNGRAEHRADVRGARGDRPRAVILAGGRGTRLAPYTSVLPKPLMPIGDRSILETVVNQLSNHGFADITFCVGYLSHLIRAVFDTRAHDDVNITYVQEEHSLGTAAPLRLVAGLDAPFLLMNGDVLTTLDYRDLLDHHVSAGNILTVATRERMIKIDYGVVHVGQSSNGFGVIRGWEEKPEIVSTVSMGIYVVEPAALSYIPPDGYFDLPDLVRALLAENEQVGTYGHDGLWFDIGRHEDYAEAVATWLEASERLDEAAQRNGHNNGSNNGHAPATTGATANDTEAHLARVLSPLKREARPGRGTRPRIT